jgi:hypothetical protein
MPRMTVSMPDELIKKFKKELPEVNLAEVVRRGIIRKLDELERVEELKKRGVV